MLSPGEIEDPQITSEQLLSLKSDIKIINMLEDLSKKYCPLQFKEIENGGRISKSNEKATTVRSEGENLFKQKKYMKALLLFTEGIANAENGSEILGLLYASRAELLFDRGLYRECLEDVEMALENNCPKRLESQLKDWRMQAESRKQEQLAAKYHEEIPIILNPNSKIPCASDSVEIQKDESGGRFILATRNIDAGEIVVVEKPYVSTVRSCPSQKYLHCHECLEFCYNLKPCQNCRTALYCSDKCRTTAKQTYHFSECDLFQFDFLEQLNIKIVLKGLSELTSSDSDKKFDGTVYKSDRYEEIQELQTNKEKRPVRDLFEAANEASIYHHFLKKYSDFFSKINITGERLKELLFHHYLSTSCNKICVQKIKKTSVDTEFHEVGEAIYAFSSLLNHHCYGNITPSFYGSTIVLQAACNIQMGESCCLTYRNFNFAEFPKLVRSHQLWKLYHFTCKCAPCENNWPIFECLNVGDVEEYQKVVDLIKERFNDANDTSDLLKKITKWVTKMSSSEPTKVDVNIKRIFCDLLKMSGNRILVL